MPVFMSARCAFHPDGRAVQNVGLLKSDTQESAEIASQKKTSSDFPLNKGWKHVILVTELSKVVLLKMAENAQ